MLQKLFQVCLTIFCRLVFSVHVESKCPAFKRSNYFHGLMCLSGNVLQLGVRTNYYSIKTDLSK